jgi:HK97 family phage major capsid protein
MKTLEKLQERYADLETEFDGVYEAAENQERNFTTEETTRMKELASQMKELEKQINDQHEIEARRAKNAEAKSRSKSDARRTVKHEDAEEKAAKRYSFLKAVRSQLPNAGEKLDGIELEMHQEAQREARQANITDLAGIGVPSFFLRFQRSEQNDEGHKRAMTVGTATAGGNLVDTELRGLIPFLRPRLAVEAMGATTLTGLTSNIDFPRNTSTTSAAWEGETDDNADSQPALDKVQMTPHRLGANTPLSKQLIVQSSIDVEAMVRRQLERAIQEALDYAAINGDSNTNANQPDGILNIAGINAVAIDTNGGSLTYSHIVQMETEIATDNADFGRLGYLTTPGVRGFLKTTEKATNTGMFVWNDGAMPTDPMDPRIDEMNGYRAYVSTQVPSDLTKGSGTNLHAVLFGNFEELLIGQWGGLDLVVDPYSLKKKAQIEMTVNTWWDIAVRHAASFCAIKDANITTPAV